MQGNERHNTGVEKEFEDRSWAEMQKILDMEMPQSLAEKNGKKRYLLLLLFLFIGFGTGVGTMLYFNQQDNLEMPTPIEIQKKDIAETSIILENEQQITPQENISNSVEKKQIIQPQNPNILTQKPLKADRSGKGQIKNDKPFVAQNQESVLNQLPEIASTIEVNSKSPNENQNYMEHSNFDFERITPLESITSKSFVLESSTAVPKMKILPTPKTKKWSFGIVAGNFLNNNKIAAGFTAGGKATFDLNHRFTIGGGLQYSIYTGFKEGEGFKNRNADAQAISLENEPSQDTSANNDFESTIVLDNYALPVATNSELPISNLQYIEMPIEIAYRFSEKFQMNIGVKGGYLIGSKTDGNVDFNNSLNSTQRSSEKDNEQIFRKSLNRFDVAASLGIGFYPSKKVGIDLRYNHGMVDITKNDSWPNNQVNANKNIQLSVLYFFGKK